MTVRIQYDTALIAASANCVCLSQTPGAAGPLTLNGTSYAGSYKFDTIEHELGEGYTMHISAKGKSGGRS